MLFRSRTMSDLGNKEVFAKNLLYYLEITGKTQKDIAIEIGVTPAAINEWVRKKKYPRIDKIELLARYFGIRKSDLIEDKSKRTSSSRMELSEGEKAMIDLFRQIPESKQSVVLEMIRLALKTQE